MCNERTKQKKMINKQNNIKVKETTKVKNLRYNPYIILPGRVTQEISIISPRVNISAEISPPDGPTPSPNTAIGFHYEILKSLLGLLSVTLFFLLYSLNG